MWQCIAARGPDFALGISESKTSLEIAALLHIAAGTVIAPAFGVLR